MVDFSDPFLTDIKEVVVAAKRIGRETVRYVSNIYKYYIVYSFFAEEGKL
jgi:hypothetical protein